MGEGSTMEWARRVSADNYINNEITLYARVHYNTFKEAFRSHWEGLDSGDRGDLVRHYVWDAFKEVLGDSDVLAEYYQDNSHDIADRNVNEDEWMEFAFRLAMEREGE